MARSLQERIIAEIGYRKVVKYFPSEEEPEEGDLDTFEEIVAEALRHVGETIPILVTSDFTANSHGLLDVSPIGPNAGRNLMVERVILTGTEGRLDKPICKAHVTIVDDGSGLSSGWYVDSGFVYFTGASYQVSTAFKVEMRVVPTEEELADNVHWQRAAVLFGAAAALERIADIAARETRVIAEGVPDVRDNAEAFLKQAETLRHRATQLLGMYVAGQ